MWDKLTRRLERIVALEEQGIPMTIFHIPEIQKFIIKLNTADQLFAEGIDANGRITGVYSYTSAILSGENHYIYNGLVAVKKFGEPFNFYDTGEFFESFQVKVYKDGFTIVADTQKDDKDLMEYGPLLGLTDQSKYELSQKMLPFLVKEIRREIFA